MPRITPRAKQLLDHMQTSGSITSREAMLDLDMPGGSLTRRITELIDAGYPIRKEPKAHPVSGRPYTRYHYDLAA